MRWYLLKTFVDNFIRAMSNNLINPEKSLPMESICNFSQGIKMAVLNEIESAVYLVIKLLKKQNYPVNGIVSLIYK